jgi:hypothetical protein
MLNNTLTKRLDKIHHYCKISNLFGCSMFQHLPGCHDRGVFAGFARKLSTDLSTAMGDNIAAFLHGHEATFQIDDDGLPPLSQSAPREYRRSTSGPFRPGISGFTV